MNNIQVYSNEGFVAWKVISPFNTFYFQRKNFQRFNFQRESVESYNFQRFNFQRFNFQRFFITFNGNLLKVITFNVFSKTDTEFWLVEYVSNQHCW